MRIARDSFSSRQLQKSAAGLYKLETRPRGRWPDFDKFGPRELDRLHAVTAEGRLRMVAEMEPFGDG